MTDATRPTEADIDPERDDACSNCGAAPARRFDLVPMFGHSRRPIGGTALCDPCLERLNTFPEDDVPLWRREEALQRRLARRAASHASADGAADATPPPELPPTIAAADTGPDADD
jgi:hypothetical protein